MSFGKLNILQHKSWNVWNRDNIEKVALAPDRRAEQRAALLEFCPLWRRRVLDRQPVT